MIPQWELTTANLLAATLRYTTPLILGALAGLFSERSGIINIAIEGIMLIGAFFAVVGTFFATEAGLGALAPWVGLLTAIVAGIAVALIHGAVSIRYKANQVVSGVAINTLATGLTAFLLAAIFGKPGQSPEVMPIPQVDLTATVPFKYLFFWLDYIPVLRVSLGGPLTPFIYIALALVAICWWVLFRTPTGLRIRSVGEHPKAADTVGVKVASTRYLGVALSGALGGIAGASLSIGLLSGFSENMTSGRGFIALAAMIFGKWNPVGALLASLLFGLSEAGGGLAQALGLGGVIPTEFILMAPYVLTMLALAGFVGRATPPSALGVPYEKGQR